MVKCQADWDDCDNIAEVENKSTGLMICKDCLLIEVETWVESSHQGRVIEIERLS